MPPIRRKKKGEEDSTTSSQSSKTTAKSTMVSKPTTSRTNPMGNKAGRPAKMNMSPVKPDPIRPISKTQAPRQNAAKASVKKQPLKTTAAVVREPKRAPTPLSPVSPVAHDHNQIARREATPPSPINMELERQESEEEDREMVVRTPTSTMKRRPGTRKISRFEKDRIIENIKYEVERRAKALRQRNALQADMLRQSIELRVGRIPYKMRDMTMGELYDQSRGITESNENKLEAQKTVKELEDVRRLSNPSNNEAQLKVAKKRAVSPAPLKHVQAPTSAIPIRSPITTMGQIIQPSRMSPIQAVSPIKPTFTQKTVASIKNRLAPKKTGVTTAASRTTTKGNTASAAAAAAVAKTTKTKATKAKVTTTTTTATKPAGRALRTRK